MNEDFELRAKNELYDAATDNNSDGLESQARDELYDAASDRIKLQEQGKEQMHTLKDPADADEGREKLPRVPFHSLVRVVDEEAHLIEPLGAVGAKATASEKGEERGHWLVYKRADGLIVSVDARTLDRNPRWLLDDLGPKWKDTIDRCIPIEQQFIEEERRMCERKAQGDVALSPEHQRLWKLKRAALEELYSLDTAECGLGYYVWEAMSKVVRAQARHAGIHASRLLSDAALINDGATFAEQQDGSMALTPTLDQLEAAHQEMEESFLCRDIESVSNLQEMVQWAEQTGHAISLSELRAAFDVGKLTIWPRWITSRDYGAPGMYCTYTELQEWRSSDAHDRWKEACYMHFERVLESAGVRFAQIAQAREKLFSILITRAEDVLASLAQSDYNEGMKERCLGNLIREDQALVRGPARLPALEESDTHPDTGVMREPSRNLSEFLESVSMTAEFDKFDTMDELVTWAKLPGNRVLWNDLLCVLGNRANNFWPIWVSVWHTELVPVGSCSSDEYENWLTSDQHTAWIAECRSKFDAAVKDHGAYTLGNPLGQDRLFRFLIRRAENVMREAIKQEIGGIERLSYIEEQQKHDARVVFPRADEM